MAAGALGGAIYVSASGTLNIAGNFSLNGSSVTGGIGGDSGAGNGSAFGSGIFVDAIDFNQVNLTPGAGQTVTIAGDIADPISAGATGSSVGLLKSGAGLAVLSGNNSYSGGTQIAGGTLSVSADQNLGAAGSGVVLLGGGTLCRLNGTATFNRHNARYAGRGRQHLGHAPGNLSPPWNGQLSGNVNSFCDGSCASFQRTSRVSGGGTLILTNESNFMAGNIYVTGNSELIGTSNNALGTYFGTGGPVFLGDSSSGGTLGFGAGGWALPRDVTLGAGGGTLDVIGASAFATSTGVISGVGSLTKAGDGTLVLSGANAYSGATIVNGGTLVASSATAFGTSTSLFVNTGATADFSGNSFSFYALNGGGTVADGRRQPDDRRGQLQ